MPGSTRSCVVHTRLKPGEDPDFNISNSADLVSTFNETNQTFTLLLAGIAAVSLIVGGIGIMNIMLVSVTERTREIGVRKALGATRLNVMLQFLIEALVLCVLGGLLGVLAGFGGSLGLHSVHGVGNHCPAVGRRGGTGLQRRDWFVLRHLAGPACCEAQPDRLATLRVTASG